MAVFNFKLPRSRLFQAKPQFSVANPISGELVQTRDMILNLSIARIAATDNKNYEIEAQYSPDLNCLEIDIPDYVLEFLTEVEIGPKFRCFLDWLNGLKGVNPTDGGGVIPVGSSTYRVNFTAADWSDGVKNEIVVLREGTPAAGQIGPHQLPLEDIYVVQVVTDNTNEVVEVSTEFDIINGNIILKKSPLSPDFDGRVIIVADASLNQTVSKTKSINFNVSDWVANKIIIPKLGPLSSGEIGPHGLLSNGPYLVQVFKNELVNLVSEVNVKILTDISNGTITLEKTISDFNGYVVISEPTL